MIFFNKNKNKKEDKNKLEIIDFQKINNEIGEYINKTSLCPIFLKCLPKW